MHLSVKFTLPLTTASKFFYLATTDIDNTCLIFEGQQLNCDPWDKHVRLEFECVCVCVCVLCI